MKLTKPVCERACLLCILFDHMTPVNMRKYVSGFNRLNFDRNAYTGNWRTFYGSSSKGRFRRGICGKFSNRRQILFWPTAMSPKNLQQYHRSNKQLMSYHRSNKQSMSYHRSNKQPMSYHRSNKQPMSYPRRASGIKGLPQQMNKNLTSFVFLFTEINLWT